MSNRIFYSEYFYQKGSKDTSVLERNANEYPYSSLASFLLLYHYKKTSNPAFEKFARKTALLFNNPHWLQFQLFDKSATISEHEIFSDKNFKDENEVPKNWNREIPLEASSMENVIEESASKLEQEISRDENIRDENQIVTIETNEIPLGTSSMEDVTEESVPTFGQETFGSEGIREENEITTIDHNETFSENSSIENVIERSNAVSEESALTEMDVAEINEVNAGTVVDSFDENRLPQESQNEEILEEPALTNSIHTNEFIETENALNETPVDEDAVIETVGDENMETEKEGTVTENERIAFEPLHTVDYFASQGIKITEELLTKDRLGSQMKSFTAWLKSMKKLHPGKLEEQSLTTEKLIQASANESNFNTEILTEAMAEVLIKQDKKEKAIEMFTKLSLINPSKSAYFAARIESIKSN